ncbi:MAG TPA: hypothetical protein VLA36_15960 [Longimicrobiales bacterium]|nr:hypothetical protein [Longimicrobiales bacterium]
MNSTPRSPALRARLLPLALVLSTGLPLAAPRPATAQSTDMARAFAGMTFRNVGPSRGGRVTAVAGHRAHPYTFYMGATGGGVWKTEDYGTTWRPISDGQIRTGSIGAIRVAPSDENVVYVGTGSDGIRSNVIRGTGVYRSNDAGQTWGHVGLEDVGQIGAVEIHPSNPDVAFVAALGHAWGKNDDRGVYKTTDGGRNWKNVLFTSDSVGAIDLELNPANPDEIYASMWRGQRQPWTIISGMEAAGREDGIWKSTDGGETWRIVTQGLPTDLIGKIDLAVSPADPNRVYALVETVDPNEGLYRSDDRGETWTLASNQAGLMNRPFYYTNVDADPKNADVVYVNNEGFYKSTDGGRSFQRTNTPHGDNHDMWINPDNTDVFVQSNDGGANVTLDGGRTWSTQSNQPTAELYSVDVDNRFPYWLYSGQQDNTTVGVPSNPPEESAPGGHTGYWTEIGGCETGPAVPKPDDWTIVYANCKGRFGRYNQRTGQEKQYYVGAVNLYGTNPEDLPYRFQRVAPIEVSPTDPGTVYHGSQFLHRTTDEGVTWEQISPDLTANVPDRQVVSGWPITRDITGEEHYSVIYAIEASPLERGVIYTGANDGPVYVTRDNGTSWTDITPPMPAEGRIQSIDVSPHTPGKVYVSAYRILLDDHEPYGFRSNDYGSTWTRITTGSNGIPDDEPVRVIREDPVREGLLFAGTEFSLYASLDDGGTWHEFRQNMPNVPVTDLRIAGNDLVLSTMGRSFWVMDDLTPLRQWRSTYATAKATLFQPADAFRVRRGGGFGFGGRSPDQPVWSPQGATLDYALGADAQSVKLEILNGSGQVLRTYQSSGGGQRTQQGQAMRAPFTMTTGSANLGTGRGVHRLTWDLTVQAEGAGRRGGPMVPPGGYQARLTVDGDVQTKSFEVKIDPRVAQDGVTVADVVEQYELSLQVLAAMSDASATIEKVEGAMERAAQGGDIRAELAEIEAALVTDRTISSYPQPMLADQIQYLYSMLQSADQKPGKDAYQRLDTLKAELERHKARLERLLRTIT